MTECAFWRRLDRPGHDAARLRWTASGWRLEGAAVFMHDNGPASLIYTVDMDTGWKTLRAHVRGFLASDSVNQLIRRTSEGWFLNGSKAEGLNHLVDVDFGFTPATNLQQLRRVDLSPGKATELPVAWLDAGASTLIELPNTTSAWTREHTGTARGAWDTRQRSQLRVTALSRFTPICGK